MRMHVSADRRRSDDPGHLKIHASVTASPTRTTPMAKRLRQGVSAHSTRADATDGICSWTSLTATRQTYPPRAVAHRRRRKGNSPLDSEAHCHRGQRFDIWVNMQSPWRTTDDARAEL